MVALLFVTVGVWVGRRLTRVKIITSESEFTIDEAQLKELGITMREYEVLGLIAAGLSNQEIADKLFVSTSTIKTHTSNLFMKLDASPPDTGHSESQGTPHSSIRLLYDFAEFDQNHTLARWFYFPNRISIRVLNSKEERI